MTDETSLFVGLQAMDRRVSGLEGQLASQAREAEERGAKMLREHEARAVEKWDSLQNQLDRRVASLEQDIKLGDDRLQEYIEAIFSEHKRAVEIAEREREKAAQALLEQEREARQVAEAEREKTARALREGLERSIREGDDRLREHITNQFTQISAGLESSEKLELQRMRSVEAHIEAVQEGLRQAQAASNAAIQKAETANEKRFEAVNEFRAQLNDQATHFLPREVYDAKHDELRKKMDEITAQRTTLLPREVFDRTLEEWTTWRAATSTRLAEQQGGDRRQERTEAKQQPWAIWAAGAVLAVIIILVNLAAALA